MMTQEVIVVRVNTLEKVLKYWPFFLEGLEELNQLSQRTEPVTPEQLLKTLLYAVEQGDEHALLVVMLSKNEKPLLWGLIMDNTVLFKPKTCVVYAVYSNNKAAGIVPYALQLAEEWARKRKFTAIQAFSPSMNGSRFRLFEKVWGFQRWAMVFCKRL